MSYSPALLSSSCWKKQGKEDAVLVEENTEDKQNKYQGKSMRRTAIILMIFAYTVAVLMMAGNYILSAGHKLRRKGCKNEIIYQRYKKLCRCKLL